MMTDEQLNRLKVLVDLGQQITFMSRHPRLAEMADAAGVMVAEEFQAAFPEAIPAARANRLAMAEQSETEMEGKKAKGNELWELLHTHALKPGTDAEETEWLRVFIGRVQDELCPRCAAEMRRYIRKNPIKLEDFFGWSVRFHNNVNARLNKKILTDAEARKRWVK